MQDAHEFEESFLELTEVSRELMPDLNKAYYGQVKEAVYNDHPPGLKTKRLVALGIAVQSGCRPCIISQTGHALNQGASVEEIMGVCSVAVSMGGTLAWSNLLLVVKYLQEKGLIQSAPGEGSEAK